MLGAGAGEGKGGNGLRHIALCAISISLLAAGPARALDWEAYSRNPGDLVPPLDYIRLAITTTDSAQVAAWYVPPQDSAGTPAAGRRPAVLIFPPEDATMDGSLPVIQALVARGFGVLAFDHRGRGASGPFTLPEGALVAGEYLTDGQSALDILWHRPETDTLQIGAYGEGLEAATALGVAGRRPEIRAVVAVSPPYNWSKYREVLAKENPGTKYYVPNTWKRGDEPDKVMNRYNGAILFVTGDADTRTPPSMARDLAKRTPRPTEVWIVPGAGHGDADLEALLGGAYFDRVAAFLTRQLAEEPRRGWPDQ